MVKHDVFIRYIFTNIDTSLASTDEHVMGLYATLVDDEACKRTILDMILNELGKLKSMMGMLIERPMEERRQNHYYSTLLRAKPLEQLHRFQVELLRRWRKAKTQGEEEQAEEFLFEILKSINAIANAIGNTG